MEVGTAGEWKQWERLSTGGLPLVSRGTLAKTDSAGPGVSRETVNASPPRCRPSLVRNGVLELRPWTHDCNLSR